MYIEFNLPLEHLDSHSQWGYHSHSQWSTALQAINQALHTWSDQYQIPYNTKLVKHTKRITFDSDESYSLFALTWMPDPKYSKWTNFKLITDLNNKI